MGPRIVEGGRKREQVGEEQNLGFGVESSRERSLCWRMRSEESGREEGLGWRLQHLKSVCEESADLNASVKGQKLVNGV